MKSIKPVWSEGGLLSAHLLQQNDNYWNHQIASNSRSFIGYPYGILDLEINEEIIQTGYFQINKLQCMLPDGTPGHLPWIDPTPLARSFVEFFSHNKPTLSVYLAVPLQRDGFPAHAWPEEKDSPLVRYHRKTQIVFDEVSGENEIEIEVSTLNFRILFEGESLEGYSWIKLAEIRRTMSNTYALVSDFIPPLLRITASLWLKGLLQRIVDVSSAKIDIYGDRRRQYTQSLADFGPQSEQGVFYLLFTMNGNAAGLRQMLFSPLTHPEKLYENLCRYLGELMTFSFKEEDHIRTLPLYNHDDLRFTFKTLGERILQLLDTVIPTRCVPILLVQDAKQPNVFHGRIDDDDLLRIADFYFALNPNGSQTTPQQAIQSAHLKIKIAAQDVLPRLTGVATGGINLKHQSSPPGPVPQRSGFQYFSLDQTGQHWEGVKGTKTISVYMPNEFLGSRIEMYAVKP